MISNICSANIQVVKSGDYRGIENGIGACKFPVALGNCVCKGDILIKRSLPIIFEIKIISMLIN